MSAAGAGDPSSNIPAELRERNQWVLWRPVERDGKTTKAPYRAHEPNREASSTDAATWAPHKVALAALERNQAAGVGFVFTDGDPYVGVDLDGCLDPETGGLAPWAAEIVGRLAGYAEASPSGRGVHVIVRGGLTGRRRRRGPVEVYESARYFTMTGNIIGGPVETIPEAAEALRWLEETHLAGPEVDPPTPRPVEPVSLDDRDLLDRARNGAKFEALYDQGDWQAEGFDSPSEADLSLCSMLAFWTGRDTARMDRLFRASALMREKWERGDYRAGRLETAVGGCREVYSNGSGLERATSNVPTPERPTAPAYEGGCAAAVVRLADVEERPVDWLARGVIPFGALTQLIGRGGVGKTTFAAHVGARLTRGQAVFPDLPSPEPAGVLIVSAEDSIAHVLTARFRLAGADMTKVHAVDLAAQDVTFPESVDWLDGVAAELGVRMVVLDPLSAFLGGRVDSHKDASLRTMLRPIHALAERRSMAVLGVLHVNQAQSGDVATKVSGSGAWVNAARSALVFGRMPDAPDDDPRRVAIVEKSNYGPKGIAYEVRLEVPPGEEHPALVYVGRSEVEGREVLADPAEFETRQERTVAQEFLIRVLGEGERLSVDVYAEAEAEGISQRTLDRARKNIGVASRREGFGKGGKTYMRLPDPHTPPPPPAPPIQRHAQERGGVWENPHGERDHDPVGQHAPPCSARVENMAEHGVDEADLDRWQGLASGSGGSA